MKERLVAQSFINIPEYVYISGAEVTKEQRLCDVFAWRSHSFVNSYFRRCWRVLDFIIYRVNFKTIYLGCLINSAKIFGRNGAITRVLMVYRILNSN